MSKIKVSFTDQNFNIQEQEKLLEEVKLRYLKTLKTKKLNTKNPQIKYFPCLKYVMIYRPDLYNLQTRKKQLKK